MIRGKKNYLPACQLAMGLSFMFRLEDTFIERHQDERKVRNANNELADEKSSGRNQCSFKFFILSFLYFNR